MTSEPQGGQLSAHVPAPGSDVSAVIDLEKANVRSVLGVSAADFPRTAVPSVGAAARVCPGNANALDAIDRQSDGTTAASTSGTPRCLDGGDVDLLHRHHCREGALRLAATSRKRLG